MRLPRRMVPRAAVVAIASLLTVGTGHAQRSLPPGAEETIVAARLDPPAAGALDRRRVRIRGELVRLGREEIDEDFAVSDHTGIAPLDFELQVIENAQFIEALLSADEVEVLGTVAIEDPSTASGFRPRLVVDSMGDIVFHTRPSYRAMAQGLGLVALLLLIVHLVSRRRDAERRTREIAAFTRELDRRERILEAVGYAAQRFLRGAEWEASVPHALERVGRAAGVTRATVYTIDRRDGRPAIGALAEWIDESITHSMGEAARSDLDTAQDQLPRWRECFLRNEVVAAAVGSLPEAERQYLVGRGIRSVAAIPIRVEDRLGGLLLLTDHLREREWPGSELDALKIAADTIGAAIERRRAESALAEAEERFRQMAEHIREVFFLTDARSGDVLYLSPAFEEVWGRTREEALADPSVFRNSVLPEDRCVCPPVEEDVGSAGDPHESRLEYRIRRPDGAVRWIRSRSYRISDEEGRPLRIAGVCTDITEQKKLEEELRRANRIEAMGHLAAGIAHEINTPIQYIGGNLEFLNESYADLREALDAYRSLLAEAEAGHLCPARIEKIAAIVAGTDIDFIVEEAPRASAQALDGVRRVSEIVRAMKEFSHPGSGSRIPTDLNHAILSTTTVARSEWKYVAELTTDLDPDLPRVPCLPGELNQAILNLVVNAAHSIADRQRAEGHHQPGAITVSTARAGEWVEIQVRDTGTGIPKELHQRIFDPFFTTKEVGRGTGQGLTFVHAIVVDQHGGTVTFDTEMGVGTTFIVRLPSGAGLPDLSEAA